MVAYVNVTVHMSTSSRAPAVSTVIREYAAPLGTLGQREQHSSSSSDAPSLHLFSTYLFGIIVELRTADRYGGVFLSYEEMISTL